MTESEPAWFVKDPDQRDTLEAFVADGSNGWVWLARHEAGSDDDRNTIAQFCALLPADRAAVSLRRSGWEVNSGSAGFGFTTSYADGEPEHTYSRFPDDGIELLATWRSFAGARPGYWEVLEEMRLVFNLWQDPRTRNYWLIDAAGDAEEVIRHEEFGIRASMRLVHRFQAIKQLHLALYLEATRWGVSDAARFDDGWEYRDHEKAASYWQGESHLLDDSRHSWVQAKRVLPPPPRETSAVWPFDDKIEPALTFIIGTTPTGAPVEFTSDPEQLANYFGANPDNPHYLTPVFFKRDVLTRYFADPDRFHVRDGYLSCHSLWGLELDNDLPDHVMVWLGDLGRDLPRSEAKHWRNFNVQPPESGPSITVVRRALANQWAEPLSADHRFRRAYRSASAAWRDAFGYPLFKPLHGEDEHVLATLRIPITEGAHEFDGQVLSLAKLLADALNDEGLTERLTTRVKGEKSISKLTRVLRGLGREDASDITKPIADVQGLRSRGAAHLKGGTYDVTQAIGDANRRDGFQVLLANLTDSLELLMTIAEEHEPGVSGS